MFIRAAAAQPLWQSPCSNPMFAGGEQTLMKVSEGETPETHVSQLALLHRISAIVNSDLSLQKMLDELIQLVVGVTNCDACLVYLLEPARDEIVLCASQLPHAGEIGSIRLRSGEGITGWVAKHQSVVA